MDNDGPCILIGMIIGAIITGSIYLNIDLPREALVRIMKNGDAACAQFGGLKKLDLGGDYECVRSEVDEK